MDSLGFRYTLGMPWTPPTKYLKNKETLDSERFFRLLGEQSNYIDQDTAFVFYMALVTLIGAELRRHKFIRLPHLGDMALVAQKPRPGWIGRMHVVMGSREVLRFYPKEKLRRYFNKRQGLARYSESLPPAQIK